MIGERIDTRRNRKTTLVRFQAAKVMRWDSIQKLSELKARIFDRIYLRLHWELTTTREKGFYDW